MLTDTQSWERNSLDELRKVANEYSLTEFNIGWDHAVQGLQWLVEGVIYDEYPSYVETKAYGGEDRMVTERAAHAVAQAAKRRGINLNTSETKISSKDTIDPVGRSGKAKVAKPTPLRLKPASLWSRVRAAAAPHFAAYVVAVAAAITASVVLVLWGIAR